MLKSSVARSAPNVDAATLITGAAQRFSGSVGGCSSGLARTVLPLPPPLPKSLPKKPPPPARLLRCAGLLPSASFTPSSMQCFKPSCVSADVSQYACAPISLASFRASATLTKSLPRDSSLRRVASSLRKSDLQPTSSTWARGQWCVISGIHLLLTLANDEGDATLKQTRNTSVAGYESGRSRS